MPELVAPTVDLYESWCEARAEFGDDTQLHGTGFDPSVDLSTAAAFADWVAHLRRQADESIPTEPNRVHCTFRWLVEGDTYLGAINLRHRLNEFLARAGGHIGYSIRPSARRRGLASWALHETLRAARERGIDRVLITCVDGNIGSARTIERAGGVLENLLQTPEFGLVRRYWITLTPR
jgi:predicted acetyltransferase